MFLLSLLRVLRIKFPLWVTMTTLQLTRVSQEGSILLKRHCSWIACIAFWLRMSTVDPPHHVTLDLLRASIDRRINYSDLVLQSTYHRCVTNVVRYSRKNMKLSFKRSFFIWNLRHEYGEFLFERIGKDKVTLDKNVKDRKQETCWNTGLSHST